MVFAGDCEGFIQDLKQGQPFSDKGYQEEAAGLYVPPAFCAHAPMNIVSESAERPKYGLSNSAGKIITRRCGHPLFVSRTPGSN